MPAKSKAAAAGGDSDDDNVQQKTHLREYSMQLPVLKGDPSNNFYTFNRALEDLCRGGEEGGIVYRWRSGIMIYYMYGT